MKQPLLLIATLFLFVYTSLAQNKVISGQVTDEKGLPIEGVTVKVKGTGTGSTTDKNGFYSIRVKSGDVLVFSGIGLAEQELTIDNQASLNVKMAASLVDLSRIEIVGSRSPKRSSVETPVPVDVIPVSRVMNQLGQVDINQILQYVAPSFNSNRQSGADGADHVDPATLRGLGPDQTLVLINGKRRHQSSLVNIYGTRGRGNNGTDLNTIPAAAIERIEILRDGASAQYGSDAIAGVVNIILKSSTKQLTANLMAGSYVTGYGSSLESSQGKILSSRSDGFTTNANVNYGFPLKNNGYINLTGDYLNKQKTYRPNYETLYPDNYRKQFGDGAITNYSFWLNYRQPLKGNTEVYAFGGFSQRNGDAYAFTRDPESERNVLAIYPNGFDPRIQSDIQDKSLSVGLRTKFGAWNADFNTTAGSNRFGFDVANTLNASLEEQSPTQFDAGGFSLAQYVLSANFSKPFPNIAKGMNLAFGTEFRNENYKIFAGETDSWKTYGPVIFEINGTDTTYRPGGSQGFPGYRPTDVVNQGRSNIGGYVDAELDITDQWLVAGAIRLENYSDFGFTHNYKLATKLKLSDKFFLRGSVSTGFRAPSLPQIYYSSTFTNVVAGEIFDQVIAPNTSVLAKTVGIPELKQEKSVNISAGFTTRPPRSLSFTVDAYFVTIKDRIVLTGIFDTNDDQIGDILQSLNVSAAQFFTNALDTKTKGIDIIGTHSAKLGGGRLSTTLAANFNDMTLENIKTIPELEGKEDIYFGPREKAFLLASAPPHKISLYFDYALNRFNAFLRFTNFAKLELVDFNNEIDSYESRITTDFSVGYKLTDQLNLTVGGSNIFDVYPTHQDPGLTESGGMWDAVQMGFGGAFYFIRLGLKL